MKRDSSTEEEASSRLNSQLPLSEKVKYADIIIDNTGSLDNLKLRVDEVLLGLERHAGSFWWRLEWVLPPFAVLMALRVIAWRYLKRTWSPMVRKDE